MKIPTRRFKRDRQTSPYRNAKNKSKDRLKEEVLLEEALSVLKKAKTMNPRNQQDSFGEHVGQTLRSIKNEAAREFAKVKIQEILYQAQFGQGIFGQGIFGQGIFGQGIFGQGIFSAEPTCTENQYLSHSYMNSTRNDNGNHLFSYINLLRGDE